MKPGLYRHYKGQDYFVTALARHSETEESLVLYFPLYGDEPSYWVRPAEMFSETVMIEGQSKPRFEFIRNPTNTEYQTLQDAGPLGITRQSLEVHGADSAHDSSPAETLANQPSSTWFQSVITMLGAAIFGLGILLFFAYNWQIIPKPGKLALVFTTLLLSHGLGLFFGRHLSRQQRAEHRLSQGFHGLGTLVFGAGIFLIAQIYHMDEHFPNAFAIWGAGALLMAWVLPSIWQGLLATTLLCAWGSFETLAFDTAHGWSIVAVSAGIVPLAFIQQSRVLLTAALISIWFLTGCVIVLFTGSIYLWLHVFASIMLLPISNLVESTRWNFSRIPLKLIGATTYLAMLFEIARHSGLPTLSYQVPSRNLLLYLEIGMAVGAIMLPCIALIQSFRKGMQAYRLWQLATVVAGSTVLVTIRYTHTESGALWILIAANLLLLAHALLLMIGGLYSGTIWRLATGFGITLLLVFLRFHDFLDSLLARSVSFLLIGVLFFIIGLRFNRQQASASNTESGYA